MQLNFENLRVLWALLAVLFLATVMLWYRRRNLLSFSWRRFFLINCSLASCILAWSRPQLGHSVMTSTPVSSSIILAVDISRSMLAEDLPPSRLQFSVAFAQKVLQRLNGARVAIFSFSSDGTLVMPFTTDLGAASEALMNLDPAMATDQGTDFSPSLQTLFHKITFMEEKSIKRGIPWSPPEIILLSDGETHRPMTTSFLRYFDKKRIPIFTVGVGTTAGTMLAVPANSQTTYRSPTALGKLIKTKLNPDNLRAIASATGGSYFSGSFAEVDRLVSQLTQSLQYRRLSVTFKAEKELYPLLFFLAFLFFGIEFSLRRWQYLIRCSALLLLAGGLGNGPKALAESSMIDISQEPQKRASIDDDTLAVQLYNQALEELRTKQLNRAAEHFQDSLFLTTDKALKKKTLYNLGNTMMQMMDPTQAIQFYQEARDLKTDSSSFEKDANQRISDNLVLASRLEKQIQEMAKQQKDARNKSKGKNEVDNNDPGGPQKNYKPEYFSNAQKERMFELLSNEEQDILKRLRENERAKNAKKISGNQW